MNTKNKEEDKKKWRCIRMLEKEKCVCLKKERRKEE